MRYKRYNQQIKQERAVKAHEEWAKWQADYRKTRGQHPEWPPFRNMWVAIIKLKKQLTVALQEEIDNVTLYGTDYSDYES